MSESHTAAVLFLFFSLLLAFVLILSKWLHTQPKLNSVLSEPAMVLLVGMVFSFVVESLHAEFTKGWEPGQGDDAYEEAEQEAEALMRTILSFPSEVFFLGFLPPIMFNSGYQLQREMFYRHFCPITLFAVVGTTISAFVAGLGLYGVKLLGWMGDFDPNLTELLTFGALIAATDSVSVLGVLQAKRVDPHLFSLVFGESALNDAVAIVLFRSITNFMKHDEADASSALQEAGAFALNFIIEAIGSPSMGVILAYATALLFKWTDLRSTKIIELSLYLLLMYIPFVLAEICHLSGIVTIFFTGISARRYIEPNVSKDTKKSADTVFKVAAFIAETCIFLELGLSVFGLSARFQWQFTLFAFLAVLLGRAASIYPLAALYNFSLKQRVQDPLLSSQESLEANLKGVDFNDCSMGSESSSSAASSPTKPKMWQRTKRKTPEKRRDKKISVNFMHFLWFAGLRGAVAYACARDFPDMYGNNEAIVATTMAIVFVTVVLMGGCTELLLGKLGIRMDVDEEEYMKEWRIMRRLKGCFHDFEHKYIYKTVVRERPKQHKARLEKPAPGKCSPASSDIGDSYDIMSDDEIVKPACEIVLGDQSRLRV